MGRIPMLKGQDQLLGMGIVFEGRSGVLIDRWILQTGPTFQQHIFPKGKGMGALITKGRADKLHALPAIAA